MDKETALLETKVKGIVKLVRRGYYVIVKLPNGEDITIHDYNPIERVYNVGDDFEETCYIKKAELAGRFNPIQTLRLSFKKDS